MPQSSLYLIHCYVGQLTSVLLASLITSDISIAPPGAEDLLATFENPELAPRGMGVPMWVMRGEGLPNPGGGRVEVTSCTEGADRRPGSGGGEFRSGAEGEN